MRGKENLGPGEKVTGIRCSDILIPVLMKLFEHKNIYKKNGFHHHEILKSKCQRDANAFLYRWDVSLEVDVLNDMTFYRPKFRRWLLFSLWFPANS